MLKRDNFFSTKRRVLLESFALKPIKAEGHLILYLQHIIIIISLQQLDLNRHDLWNLQVDSKTRKWFPNKINHWLCL
jgi:hypothetical protein